MKPVGTRLESGEPAEPLRRSWAASTFDAFAFPAYRVVWAGSVMAFLAFNMANAAQGVVAYQLTGSSRAVGLVLFGQGLAMTFLNPFGGAIADRFSRRFLILAAHIVIGAVIFALAVLLALDRLSIGLMAAGFFTIGSMFSFLGPTRTALVGEVLPEGRIGNGMALIQVGGNFARIAAPPLAGLMLSWPLLGSAGTFFIVSALFILVLATLYRLPVDPPRVARTTSVLDDIRGGIGYTLARPDLLHAVISFHAVLLLGFSFMVVMPGYATDVLAAGASGYGILLGVAAAGGLVTSVLVASLADSNRAQVYLSVSSLVAGLALIGLGLAPGFATALLAMAFVGAGTSAFQTLNNAYAMRLTEPAFYGRVIGLMFLAWGLINVVSLPIGALADALGERTVLCGLGIALCLAVALLALWGRQVERGQPKGTLSVRYRGLLSK